MYERKIELTFDGENLNIPTIKDLRVAFDVEKFSSGINHGIIIIYNLNDSNRKELVTSRLVLKPEAKTKTISLKAGYGDDMQLIAYGDILSSKNYRVGADWITEIEYYASYKKIQLSQVSLSYAKPTLAKKIIDNIFESMFIDILYSSEALDIILNEKTNTFSDSGSAFKIAKGILNRYGLEISFINIDAVLVTVKNKGHGDVNLSIGMNDGLIGTPIITDVGAVIQTLLNPLLEVKDKIKVESLSINSSLPENISNNFFVNSINHIGDTHGDDWFTEIQVYYADIDDLGLIA